MSEVYAGLDVSDKSTHLCVVDAAGELVWRGVCATDPEVLAQTLRKRCPDAVRVVLETGALSTYLYHGLVERGVPVVCICARHAKGRVVDPRQQERSAWAIPGTQYLIDLLVRMLLIWEPWPVSPASSSPASRTTSPSAAIAASRSSSRDEDYAAYRDLVAAACAREGVRCLAWCLMPNHVHLILSPPTRMGCARRWPRRIGATRGGSTSPMAGPAICGRAASPPIRWTMRI